MPDTKLQEGNLSDFEMSLYNTVTSLLIENDLSTELIGFFVRKTYVDITFWECTMLRFKTRGKLIYWLIDIPYKTFVKRYNTNLQVSKSSPTEGDKTRLFITSNKDLLFLSDYILNQYEHHKELKDIHDEWVERGKPTSYSHSVHIDLFSGEISMSTSYIKSNSHED